MSVRSQFIAESSRPAVLPNNGIMDRFTSFSVPDDRRFTLVGDADRGDIGTGSAGAAERIGRNPDLRGPDLVGVVFDPTGLREDLREFFLGNTNDFAGVVNYQCARTGGSLIKG